MKITVKWPAFLAHVAVIMIVAGAVVSSCCGRYGYIHLRRGQGAASTWRLHDGSVVDLPFSVALQSVEESPEVARLGFVEDADTCLASVTASETASMRGYTFIYKASDRDNGGAWFLISYDPVGNSLVYGGYVLLVAVLFVIALRRKGIRTAGNGSLSQFASFVRIMAMAVCLCLVTFLYRRAMSLGVFPAVSLADTLLLVAVVSLGVSFAVIRSNRTAAAVAFGVGLLSVFGAMFAGLPGNSFAPVLANPLLGVHVSLIVIAYAFFAISTFSALLCLIARSNSVLFDFELSLLRFGVAFLAAGIAVGSFWAAASWGRFWSWDPKETWALICFLVYFFPLHPGGNRLLGSPRAFGIYLVLAFAVLVFCWFGVSTLFVGRHSYI